jgi:hypothetical protein
VPEVSENLQSRESKNVINSYGMIKEKKPE